ncbi:hypothetical protein KIN20_025697 [Parelaphostrongylus tenuis]|uniref:Uncharacterized protein n=1 Tax=Parelaphostrongylus tenuis TaxID=148309 RepID=A0AAD5N9L7_PARTN|nr:hypothetical protein KIN20_025697 [Parelaphostrongylus tenuis]
MPENCTIVDNTVMVTCPKDDKKEMMCLKGRNVTMPIPSNHTSIKGILTIINLCKPQTSSWQLVNSDVASCIEQSSSVTKMVHDPREQVLPQRIEDLRQNGPNGVGGTQLPPTSTGSSIDGHHPNGRLTSPGPPHLISLPTHYCSPHIVSLSCN